jgi:hypothetical protein
LGLTDFWGRFDKRKESNMENIKLNPPKKSTFWIAVIISVVSGILYSLQCMGVLSNTWVYPLAFLLMAIAFLLLVLGLLLKGF